MVKRPWLVDVRQIEYREQALDMGRDQVLLKHVCTAPSQGTALHMYRGDHLLVDGVRERRPWPYPWLQGFAYGVGEVEEVGADVTGFEAGDLVYTMKLTAERAVVSPDDLTPLPKGLDAESASLLFQAKVGLIGGRGANVVLGDTVLVTGQGPIGIFAAQLCQLAGAHRVIATDIHDDRLAISEHVGIDVTINPRSKDVVERVMELTEGKGADVVVEASGSPQALLQGCAAARQYGRIAVIGWLMADFTINLADDFTPKGLEMVVCHAGQNGEWRRYQRTRRGTTKAQLEAEDQRYLLDLMAQGKLASKELITHRFPLADLVEAWRFIDADQDKYVQAVFVSE
jgi:L-iditol 2-dehydrogenase